MSFWNMRGRKITAFLFMLVVAGSMTVSSYHTVKAENEETETDVIILTPDEEHPAEEEN